MALNLHLKATTRIFPILSYCSARDGSRLLWLSSSLTAHCIHSAVCLRALQTQSREQETLAQERQDMLRSVAAVSDCTAGQPIWVRARVQSVRHKGNSCFLVLRQGTATVQATLFKGERVSKEMLRFCGALPKARASPSMHSRESACERSHRPRGLGGSYPQNDTALSGPCAVAAMLCLLVLLVSAFLVHAPACWFPPRPLSSPDPRSVLSSLPHTAGIPRRCTRPKP